MCQSFKEMKNKFRIIALKTLMLWPIGAFLATLLLRDIAGWIWIISVGLTLAVAYVFWNVFEYDKYDSISSEDYLKSSHTIKLPNSKDVINMIDSETKGVFADVKLTDKLNEQGYWIYDIRNSGFGATMRVNFSSKDVVVTIKTKFFAFIPDFAKNYRIVHRLNRAAENLNLKKEEDLPDIF